MIPANRTPTHPGEILVEEFLRPLKLTQVRFAQHLRIPTQRLNEVCRGKRGISPDTAWLFSQALGTCPEFWMNLQANYDLARNRPENRVKALIHLKAAKVKERKYRA